MNQQKQNLPTKKGRKGICEFY